MARLSALVQATLFAAFDAGSYSAFEQLVEGNLGLVKYHARRAAIHAERKGYTEDDAFGSGAGGLSEAVTRWDLAQHGEFAAYASNMIRAAIQRDLNLRRSETVEVEQQNPLTGERETVKVKRARLSDSLYSTIGEGEGEATLGDTLAGEMSAEESLIALKVAEQGASLEEMAIEFAATLTVEREQAIWREKVIASNRDILPQALGCNNAARVSQIRKELISQFREYVAAQAD